MAWYFKVCLLLIISIGGNLAQANNVGPLPLYDIQTDLQLAKLAELDPELAKKTQLRIEQLNNQGNNTYAVFTAYNNVELISQLFTLASDFKDDPNNRDLRLQRQAYLEGDWSALDTKVPALRLMGQQLQGQLAQVIGKSRMRTIQATRDIGNWLLYARLMADSNNFNDAHSSLSAAVAQLQQRATELPEDGNAQYWLAVSYQYVGLLELSQQQLNPASRDLQAAAALINRQAKQNPKSEMWQHALFQSYSYLAALQLAQQDISSAKNSLNQALAIVEKQQGQAGVSPRWSNNAQLVKQQLAQLPQVSSPPRAASEPSIAPTQPQTAAPALSSEEQQLAEWARQIESYRSQQQWQQALPLAQQRVTLLSKMSSNHAAPALQLQSALAWGQLGQLQLTTQKVDAAISSFNQRRNSLQRLYQQAPNNSEYQYQLALSLAELGQAYQQKRQISQARAWYRQSLGLAEKIDRQSTLYPASQQLAQNLNQWLKTR